jgi:hypothetical protein
MAFDELMDLGNRLAWNPPLRFVVGRRPMS